jgi:large subunit ribosomal protein L3
MGLGLLGKKLGMTQVFDEHGNIVPVTVIKAGPNFIIQKKTKTKEGYNSLQVGFDEIKKVTRVNKPLTGHFKKINIAPMRLLKEFRVGDEDVDAHEIASEVSIGIFVPGDFVDVTGISKGKGFAGVVKRYGFKGAPASRGTHEFFRHGGSIGAHTFPGRTMKGRKMPGHMGAQKVTVQNLKIVDVRGDTNILIIEGAIPGPTNSYVIIRKAVKKQK